MEERTSQDRGLCEVRNPRALAALADMTSRQETLASEPRVYGVVIELPEEKGIESEPYTFKIGDHIRYVGSRHRRYHGDDGIVVTEPDDLGEILIVLKNGETLRAGVELSESFNQKQEIVLHPDEALRAVLAVEGRTVNVRRPFGLPMEIGDTIALHRSTLQIVEVIGKRTIGEIAEVVYVDAERCEVDLAGRSTRTVSVSPKMIEGIEERSRVILDPSASVIVHVFPSDVQGFAAAGDTGVDWDDIKGHNDAKAYLIDAIERPVQDPSLFRYYNEGDALGALLKGPPGCGKTLFGRACRTAQIRVYGEKAREAFLFVRGPEFLESLVGSAEKKVRRLWGWARDFRRKTGIRVILFIDEFDAIGRRRGSGISSDATDSIVNTILAETNGFDRDNPFLLYATNRPDMIDSAIVREERIDRHFFIGRPSREVAESIFIHDLAMRPLADGVTPEALAAEATQSLFDPSKVFYHLTVAEAGGEKVIPVIFGHCVSGSLITGIVREATRLARLDDQKAGTKTGIRHEHLLGVVQQKFESTQTGDLREIVDEVRATIEGPITGIRRQHHARG